MASKPTDASMPFLKLGKEQTEAMLSMQRELLDAYDQSSRAWLARVKSEVDLWSDLAKKLSTTQSVPDAVGAYQQCVAQRMQMAAEDGRRLYDDCQKITQTITRSLSNGRLAAST
jgi:phasin protein